MGSVTGQVDAPLPTQAPLGWATALSPDPIGAADAPRTHLHTLPATQALQLPRPRANTATGGRATSRPDEHALAPDQQTRTRTAAVVLPVRSRREPDRRPGRWRRPPRSSSRSDTGAVSLLPRQTRRRQASFQHAIATCTVARALLSRPGFPTIFGVLFWLEAGLASTATRSVAEWAVGRLGGHGCVS